MVARKIPVLICANKVDLRKSDIKKVEAAFPARIPDDGGEAGRDGWDPDELFAGEDRVGVVRPGGGHRRDDGREGEAPGGFEADAGIGREDAGGVGGREAQGEGESKSWNAEKLKC